MSSINKTMDWDDLFTPEATEVINETEALMRALHSEGLHYSSWYGTLPPTKQDPFESVNRGPNYKPYPKAYDDASIPWFKYWEISQIVLNSGVLEKPGKCLDMGGTSSLFSCFLADQGNDVVSLDLREALVLNGEKLATRKGWELKSRQMDLCNTDELASSQFDYVFSICVMEHLTKKKRISTVRKVKRILKPNGVFAITFDYLNPKAQINSLEDIRDQFIIPSGMELMGDPFEDCGKRYLYYLGKLYTFGSLFMKKVEKK